MKTTTIPSSAPLSTEEMKKAELDILIQVADFCEKNNLRYYLAYGTLIGAVRHRGFIPWDDDIDLHMPREDYDRLISVFNRQRKNNRLRLIEPCDKIARHSFVKIIDTQTIKIEEGIEYPHGYLGLDIDIFPLDGEPEDENRFDVWYQKLYKLYYLFALCVLPNKGSFKRRFFLPVIKALCPKKLILKLTAALHSKYPYDSSAYVGTVESFINLKNNRFPRSCFDDYILMDFEGHRFRCPVGYDTVLKKMYGNYMELPPVEQQITHHSNKVYRKEEFV